MKVQHAQRREEFSFENCEGRQQADGRPNSKWKGNNIWVLQDYNVSLYVEYIEMSVVVVRFKKK